MHYTKLGVLFGQLLVTFFIRPYTHTDSDSDDSDSDDSYSDSDSHTDTDTDTGIQAGTQSETWVGLKLGLKQGLKSRPTNPSFSANSRPSSKNIMKNTHFFVRIYILPILGFLV